MKIIRPYAKIIGAGPTSLPVDNPKFGVELLRFIEFCGRVSHRSEDSQTDDSYQRFIRNVVLDHGDWSIVEHAVVIVDAVVDRGITHEIVRHRLASYTQESTRFVNYEKKMPPSFIYPRVGVECLSCLNGNEVDPDAHTHYLGEGNVQECAYDPAWLDAIQTAEVSYRDLLARGWRPQEARSVFPNALASRIIMTYNLRTWRHIFLMRTSKEAHPQMRQVMVPLLQEFQRQIPILYEDIEPEGRQIDNLKRGR